MKHKLYFFLIVLSLNIFVVDCFQNENLNIINNFLAQYKRPITVLEITDSADYYSFELSKYFDISCCILYLGQKDKVLKDAQLMGAKKVTILNPKYLTYEMLHTLSRCEHFDATIIHNMKSSLKLNNDVALGLFLKLGDYLFIEDNEGKFVEHLEKNNNKIIDKFSSDSLACVETLKPGLDIPRWLRRHLPISETPRYVVHSSFTEKYLLKHDKRTKWLQGINLVTFIMMYGIYPENETILENIYRMKKSGHNDLVVGNMIIQGNKIELIDFADYRRDLKPRKGIKEATKLFKNKNRLNNPQVCMQEYGERLSSKKTFF